MCPTMNGTSISHPLPRLKDWRSWRKGRTRAELFSRCDRCLHPGTHSSFVATCTKPVQATFHPGGWDLNLSWIWWLLGEPLWASGPNEMHRHACKHNHHTLKIIFFKEEEKLLSVLLWENTCREHDTWKHHACNTVPLNFGCIELGVLNAFIFPNT